MKNLLYLLVVLAGTAWLTLAPAAGPVPVNFDADNAPFASAHEGRPVGIYPAIVSAAFARMGVALAASAKPWKRVLLELDDGRAGVGGIYRNAERATRYDYSAAILSDDIAVYFNTTRPLDFRTLADLDGKRVGVASGWSYGDAFDAARKAGRFAVEEAGSDQSNFLKLARGRLDAVLAIEEAGRATIVAEDLHNIGRSPVLLASNSTHLAFNKTGEQSELLARFDAVIAEMKRDGTLERIVRDEIAR